MSQENQDKEAQEDKEKKKKKVEVPLPYCTTAPDPEHHRAEDDDQPCDDARSGNIEKGKEQEE